MSMKPIFAFVMIAFVASLVSAEVTSFQEGVLPTGAYTHDGTYIRSNDGTGNFDNDPDLELIVGTTAGGDPDVLRCMLEFDVSAIPASAQIRSVLLVLTTHSNTGLDLGGTDGNPTFNVYAYGFDIDETTATWNAPGAGDPTAGGTLGTLLTSASFDVTSTGLAVTFGDTHEFRTAVANALTGDGLLRLIVAKNDESTVGTHEFTRFAADSFAATANRPKLQIEYTDDPTLPNVDAGVNMLSWSGQAVQLDPNSVNNDVAPLTYLWTADPDAGAVFSATDVNAPTVTITKPALVLTEVWVANASFESPVLDDGAFTDTPPGWTNGYYDLTVPEVWVVGYSGAGVYNPSAATHGYGGIAPEGDNVGFTTSYVGKDGGLNQVLSATLEADTQ